MKSVNKQINPSINKKIIFMRHYETFPFFQQNIIIGEWESLADHNVRTKTSSIKKKSLKNYVTEAVRSYWSLTNGSSIPLNTHVAFLAAFPASVLPLSPLSCLYSIHCLQPAHTHVLCWPLRPTALAEESKANRNGWSGVSAIWLAGVSGSVSSTQLFSGDTPNDF